MAIRWPLLVRRTHKWLALLVGVQAVLWTLTGLYMVVVHIDIIHGDHMIRPVDARPYDLSRLVEPSTVAASVPGASEVRLQRLLDQPVWRVDGPDGPRLFDAATGATLPPPSEVQIGEAAQRLYAGDGRIVSVRLLTAAPQEMQARKPPFWQVEFEGWSRPTLYFSPATGEMVGRRHALWRVFDFAWMLHIMDYDERSNVNNPLLRAATWSAFAMAVMGAWLLVWSFPRRKRKKA
ncbi:PepSY-associated transmembrane protein [Novosphingobium kunmingense]|uniref:PepSY-associated transmembrane protein n=1 Tax=Novosphingobium kunmingense TaxID=1211806 RepID=A0A2N0HJF9_9SPHN|nr:PepSY domain-containing protein [Novosphingobium kunmingense]PKB19048.1 PepSY-associated transmembrane protein [Novosphingobium kunmingense]